MEKSIFNRLHKQQPIAEGPSCSVLNKFLWIPAFTGARKPGGLLARFTVAKLNRKKICFFTRDYL